MQVDPAFEESEEESGLPADTGGPPARQDECTTQLPTPLPLRSAADDRRRDGRSDIQ